MTFCISLLQRAAAFLLLLFSAPHGRYFLFVVILLDGARSKILLLLCKQETNPIHGTCERQKRCDTRAQSLVSLRALMRVVFNVSMIISVS